MSMHLMNLTLKAKLGAFSFFISTGIFSYRNSLQIGFAIVRFLGIDKLWRYRNINFRRHGGMQFRSVSLSNKLIINGVHKSDGYSPNIFFKCVFFYAL